MESYRGRIAPTPTGWLHAGHAATFFQAAQRAREAGGILIYRLEDLDPERCRKEYALGAMEDLHWLGLRWQEGPVFEDCGGGELGPYAQSQRRPFYLAAWQALREAGWIYPSPHSRRDVAAATQAPHEEEPLFPIAWRQPPEKAREWTAPAGINWRFRVPDGEVIRFDDARCGPFQAVAGEDFADFVVWRRDDVPAYELAVVVDDAAMRVTEVVRGEDLLLSTCRQLLLYRALGLTPPRFYHTPLLRDASGRRLAKRHQSASIRRARLAGQTPEDFTSKWQILR